MPNFPSAADKYPEANPPGYVSPSEYNYDFDVLNIPTGDGYHLHGWFIRQAKDFKNKPTVIFFHGNAGNIGGRLPTVEQIYH